jgi:Cof subfamily protein (haloacid dehalogenase superfamily)
MSQLTIRLIAIDVDGTLLDSRHRVQTAVNQELSGLTRRGIKIVLATARSPQLMEAVLAQLSFVPFLICFSGAWVGDPQSSSLKQKPVWEKRISLAAAQNIIDQATSAGLEPNVFYPSEWRVSKVTREIEEESRITQVKPAVSNRLLEPDLGPHKILLIGKLGADAALLEIVAEAIRPFTAATFSKPNYLEVIAPEVNKAGSLALLAKQVGFDISMVAAIGDGHNDLEMIEAAGIGIAMGNAAPPVKSKATWVTLDNDRAGVAVAVQELDRRGML